MSRASTWRSSRRSTKVVPVPDEGLTILADVPAPVSAFLASVRWLLLGRFGHFFTTEQRAGRPVLLVCAKAAQQPLVVQDVALPLQPARCWGYNRRGAGSPAGVGAGAARSGMACEVAASAGCSGRPRPRSAERTFFRRGGSGDRLSAAAGAAWRARQVGFHSFPACMPAPLQWLSFFPLFGTRTSAARSLPGTGFHPIVGLGGTGIIQRVGAHCPGCASFQRTFS